MVADSPLFSSRKGEGERARIRRPPRRGNSGKLDLQRDGEEGRVVAEGVLDADYRVLPAVDAQLLPQARPVVAFEGEGAHRAVRQRFSRARTNETRRAERHQLRSLPRDAAKPAALQPDIESASGQCDVAQHVRDQPQLRRGSCGLAGALRGPAPADPMRS